MPQPSPIGKSFVSFRSVRSLVPLFDFPVLQSAADGIHQRLISRPVPSDTLTGWAFLNSEPITNGRGEACWSLKRVDAPNRHLIREDRYSFALKHRFTHVDVRQHDSHLSWVFSRAPTSLRHRYSVFARQTRDRVDICAQTRKPDFILPAIFPAHSVAEDERCSICWLGFPNRSISQGTGVCAHIFHFGCLSQYIRADGASCPNCRAALKEY